MVQDPWIDGKEEVKGIGIKNNILIYKRNVGRFRSCLLIRKELKYFFLYDFSDRDLTAANCSYPIMGK